MPSSATTVGRLPLPPPPASSFAATRPPPPPPSELLRSWPAFAAALREWMAAHGSLPGVMPSRDELVRTGRHDLRFAVYTHGGREVVAKRIGLVLPGCRGWVGVWLARQTGLLVTDLAAGRRMGGLKCTTAVGSRRRAALLERVAGRRAANGGASRPRGRRVGGGAKRRPRPPPTRAEGWEGVRPLLAPCAPPRGW